MSDIIEFIEPLTFRVKKNLSYEDCEIFMKDSSEMIESMNNEFLETVILDFEEVKDATSIIIASMIQFHQKASHKNMKVKMINVNREIFNIIRIINLDKILDDINHTEEQKKTFKEQEEIVNIHELKIKERKFEGSIIEFVLSCKKLGFDPKEKVYNVLKKIIWE